MLIPDLNLILYAHDPLSPRYSVAMHWWVDLLNSKRPVGLAWITIIGFLRLSTHPRLVTTPMTPSDSIRRIKSWLVLPSVRIVTPGENHAGILFNLIESVGVAGNLTSDAHLAALAIEYNAELASSDSDFARFPGLRWTNPIRS